MKRRFGVMAMAAVLSAALAVPAYAGTWKYVNDQWKYQRGANKFATMNGFRIRESIIIWTMTVM